MANNPVRATLHTYFGPDGFGGGLKSENAIIIQPNQMAKADNVLVGTVLSRRKRGGQVNWHTSTWEGTASFPATGTPIRGIYEFWRTAGISAPVSDLFVHSGTKVWSLDERNTEAVDKTGSLTLSSTGVPCYQPFNGSLYFTSTDVSDGYNKWDGTASSASAATDPADGPGKYIVAHLGKMWMAGNNAFPFRLYYSSTLDAEDWTTGGGSDGGSLDLPDDGDPEGITGIASFQNRLYVFLRRSVYELSGYTPTNFQLEKVSGGIGCLGHASIAQIPNDVVFASDRGVHSLRQLSSGRQTESQFLSRDIQRMWTELLNTALYYRMMAVYDDTINCYVLSVPSSGQTTNDNLLVYNIEFGIWTLWPNINARAISTVFLNNKKSLVIGREDGKICLINQATKTDLGSAYTYHWKTGILYPDGDMTTERRFKSVTILASNTTTSGFSVAWNVDGQRVGSQVVNLNVGVDTIGSTFVLGQSKLGTGQFLPQTITIEQVGHGIQLEVISSATADDLEVYGFILEVEDTNMEFLGG